ncbi:hypothetical protein BGZ60DRAFT_10383 [Tricladium varicosporioides]|nr:hypothetical protein BGZ60DRAFT_10383 [Hymenoscyphus varicosporioides]
MLSSAPFHHPQHWPCEAITLHYEVLSIFESLKLDIFSNIVPIYIFKPLGERLRTQIHTKP